MRHLAKAKKFHRKKGERQAFFKNIQANLVLNRHLETSDARAKEVKRRLEKLVTLAKKQDLSSLRLLVARIGKKPAFALYNEIAPKYEKRPGGYLRIIKTPKMVKRNGAKVVRLEFVE